MLDPMNLKELNKETYGVKFKKRKEFRKFIELEELLFLDKMIKEYSETHLTNQTQKN